MIEPPTARLACIRATEGDLNSIAKLLEDHKRALEASDPVNEHAAKFHVLVARASHNHIVASFMESIIGLLMERGRKVGRIPGYATQELAEHAEIARTHLEQRPGRGRGDHARAYYRFGRDLRRDRSLQGDRRI